MFVEFLCECHTLNKRVNRQKLPFARCQHKMSLCPLGFPAEFCLRLFTNRAHTAKRFCVRVYPVKGLAKRAHLLRHATGVVANVNKLLTKLKTQSLQGYKMNNLLTNFTTPSLLLLLMWTNCEYPPSRRRSEAQEGQGDLFSWKPNYTKWKFCII